MPIPLPGIKAQFLSCFVFNLVIVPSTLSHNPTALENLFRCR